MAFLTTLYAPNYQSLADRSHIFRLLNVYMALITLFADLKSLARTLNYECKRTMKLIGILTDSDGSELTPQNEQEKAEIDCQQTVNGTATDCQPVDNALSTHFTAPIISTRVDAKENREKRIGEKENKSFNQSKEENRNLLGETETGLLSFSDKKTDYETDSGGTLEEYVNGLKLESQEVESLFNLAGNKAESFQANLDKFKLKLLNRAKHQPKSKHKLPQDVTNVSP